MTSASIKLAILSDTHGHMPEATLAEIEAQQVDAIVHAGDSESAYALSQLELIAPVIAVQGNCDWPSELANLPQIAKQQFGNALLVVTHKPDDLETALRLVDVSSRSEGQSETHNFIVGIHGHTHLPVIQHRGNLVILCPGSPVEPRGGSKACIALLTLAVDGSDTPPFAELISL